MKTIQAFALALSAALLVSCLGREETPEPAPIAQPVAEPPGTNPRPDRPTPPPQKQDGSLIVKPGGTQPSPPKTPDIPEIDRSEAESALTEAEEAVRERKAAADGDDPISKALQGVSEEDLDRAFSELKKAVESVDDPDPAPAPE